MGCQHDGAARPPGRDGFLAACAAPLGSRQAPPCLFLRFFCSPRRRRSHGGEQKLHRLLHGFAAVRPSAARGVANSLEPAFSVLENPLGWARSSQPPLGSSGCPCRWRRGVLLRARDCMTWRSFVAGSQAARGAGAGSKRPTAAGDAEGDGGKHAGPAAIQECQQATVLSHTCRSLAPRPATRQEAQQSTGQPSTAWATMPAHARWGAGGAERHASAHVPKPPRTRPTPPACRTRRRRPTPCGRSAYPSWC